MTPAEIRADTMNDLVELLKKTIAKRPKTRSIMMCVAQYWADEADDAVHAHVVTSERDTPVWPHPCDTSYEEDERTPVEGEACWNCAEEFDYLNFDDNGSGIEGFQAFCSEDGSQEEAVAQNYQPYAIARRVGDTDEIAVEIVGVRRRPGDEMLATPKSRKAIVWPDDRAEQLFAQVCAHPRDDGAREVLRDHLLENDDPRGEYLSFVLGGRDAEATALLENHRAQWLDPISIVIPTGSARFERGFVAHVEIYAAEPAHVASVRGADAWGTVESLEYLDGSMSLLDEAMVALRTVGVVANDEIEKLARATRPWAIEDLRVRIDDAAAKTLRDATTLPALRRLTVIPDDRANPTAILATAPWWRRLERLTILSPLDGTWTRPPNPGDVPAVAIGQYDDTDRSVGWQLVFDFRAARVLIEHANWHGSASLEALGTILKTVEGPFELRSSKTYRATADDAAYLARTSGKPVTLA